MPISSPLRATARPSLVVAAVASIAIALGSSRYLMGIGPFPPKIVANMFAAPWLVVHVAGAATALLIGWLQFLARLRRDRPAVHRWMGRIYVVACLIGAVSGLVLAFGTTMGPVASAGFGTLAVIWFTATGLGWLRAVQRRFAAHRAWMIRSWGLTFAAVNLRLYLLMAAAAGLPFSVSYPVISFLCWLPNLLIAEWYLAAGGRPGISCPAPRRSRESNRGTS